MECFRAASELSEWRAAEFPESVAAIGWKILEEL